MTEQEQAQTATAIVLTRPLARGAIITVDDVSVASVSALGPDTLFAKPEDVVGRRLARALGPDRPLSARHLQPDWQVFSGLPVTILTETGGIRVAMAGRAKADAELGAPVEVENLSSGKSVVARVIGKDIVQVTLKPFVESP
jgi:flagella basal body P-ring formation protein FlgA